MDSLLPLVSPSSEACILRISWVSVIWRSSSFPSTRRPTVGTTSLKLPVIRRKGRPRSTSSPFLILHRRASSPLELSQPMAESLLGVEIIPEVVGPIEVIVEVGVRAPSVGHAPAVPAIAPVLPPSEQAPLWAVLGAAAVLLVPSVRQRAQVMVGWPTGIALRDKRKSSQQVSVTISTSLQGALVHIVLESIWDAFHIKPYFWEMFSCISQPASMGAFLSAKALHCAPAISPWVHCTGTAPLWGDWLTHRRTNNV